MDYKEAIGKLDYCMLNGDCCLDEMYEEFEAIKEHIAKIEEENEKLRLENIK